MAEETTYRKPKDWYRNIWLFLASTNLWFVAAFSVIQFWMPAENANQTLSLTVNTFILATIALGYLVLSYFFSLFKRNPPMTSFIGTMFTILVVYEAFMSSQNILAIAVGYAVLWGILIWTLGVYGAAISTGVALVGIVSQLVRHDFVFSELTLFTAIFTAINILAATFSYFFWRARLEITHDQELDKLSSMLQSNRQQSEILFQSISDGIIVTDTSGKITLINPAAAAMAEWKVSEAGGVDVRLVIKLAHEDGSALPSEQDPFTQVFSQNQPTDKIFQLEGREGKNIIVSLSISPIILKDETSPRGAVAVMRDISEDRAAEKQRGEFISTASHEMRTPVAAIEGYLALALNDKVSTIDSRARGFLEKAHASTTHLGKLFQDLLTSSKAEDGRLSNHPTAVEMGALLEQLTDDLKFAAEKKGLSVEFVIGGADDTIDATTKDASVQHLVKPLYYVYVDPDRIQEVVTNLFDNACKYTDSGKVSIGLTGNAEVVQMYIRDTGAGIPADDIPHLFQKFYRVDNSATRTIGGTGLGLFICRKIVELYQGRIWVESEVGNGSTFFINLPRLSTQRATELQTKEGSQTPASTSLKS